MPFHTTMACPQPRSLGARGTAPRPLVSTGISFCPRCFPMHPLFDIEGHRSRRYFWYNVFCVSRIPVTECGVCIGSVDHVMDFSCPDGIITKVVAFAPKPDRGGSG
jgi:hypothetical protein